MQTIEELFSLLRERHNETGNYTDSSYKYKSRKNTFVGKKASLVIDSPTKKPTTRKDSKFAPIKLSANKKFFWP